MEHGVSRDYLPFYYSYVKLREGTLRYHGYHGNKMGCTSGYKWM